MRPSMAPSAQPQRILIVDDESPNRELIETMLQPEGFVLLGASTAEEALAMVKRDPPDLILLDVLLPAMDGYGLTARIKGDPSTRAIPIILLTALGDHAARIRGLTAGAEDFLTKPVDRAELCARVRNLLRLKAHGDQFDHYSRELEADVDTRTAELAESERLYRSTFDTAPVGIVHIGLDGRWLRVNQRLCHLLGYSQDDLEGIATRELLQPGAPAEDGEGLRALLAGTLERHVIKEQRLRRRDGSLLAARVNFSLHRDAGGKPQHFISVIEDITELLALDAQVRQSAKMDAIGRLASGVAHDFNNLLTVILGFAEVVESESTPGHPHTRSIAEIIKAARRGAGLTRQLLAFGRQQVMNTVAVDVNQLIGEMSGMLGRLIGAQVAIHQDLAPGLSPALADRGQLEQVVMNLVVNARDAMPGGGTVSIVTAEVDLVSSSLHTESVVSGRYVLLAIADTGTGMTVETQRRAFEPFFTTKEAGKGTGLGLATTYGIVKQCSGYIRIESELGRGTTFRVYLPLERRTEGPEARPAGLASAELPIRLRETVLLVDDDASVRRISTLILEGAGYRVLQADCGEAAERVFASAADSIVLLVTDVMMPGCSGPELLRRLHLKAPGLRALFLSGYPARAVALEAGLAPGAPFVQKPFTAAELLGRTRSLIDGERAAAQV